MATHQTRCLYKHLPVLVVVQVSQVAAHFHVPLKKQKKAPDATEDVTGEKTGSFPGALAAPGRGQARPAPRCSRGRRQSPPQACRGPRSRSRSRRTHVLHGPRPVVRVDLVAELRGEAQR